MHAWQFIGISFMGCCAAALTIGACGDTPEGSSGVGAAGPEACDTDAACLDGRVCCFASPDAATGVCQASCSCVEDSDCVVPVGKLAMCCDGTCLLHHPLVMNLDCIDDADCGPGRYCDYSLGTTSPARTAGCIGLCLVEPGSGGGGGGGAGGGTAGLPPYTVVSGNPTVNGDGCLEAMGAGVTPAHVVLDETITGPVSMTVEGVLAPIPGGGGIDGVALAQSCGGGIVNGNTVEGCAIARVGHNALDNTGFIGIYDTSFNEVATDAWVPTGPADEHVYRTEVAFDIDGVTDTVEMTEIITRINGVVVSTLNATNLGPAGGDRLSVLISQASVCEITIMQ